MGKGWSRFRKRKRGKKTKKKKGCKRRGKTNESFLESRDRAYHEGKGRNSVGERKFLSERGGLSKVSRDGRAGKKKEGSDRLLPRPGTGEGN